MHPPKPESAEQDLASNSESAATAVESPDSWLDMLRKTVILQAVLLILVADLVTLKFAAINYQWYDWQFIALFTLCFGGMGFYALVWQKVLKAYSLLEAYSNKALTGVWFLLASYFIFGDESNYWWNAAGILIIAFGVSRLYAKTKKTANISHQYDAQANASDSH